MHSLYFKSGFLLKPDKSPSPPTEPGAPYPARTASPPKPTTATQHFKHRFLSRSASALLGWLVGGLLFAKIINNRFSRSQNFFSFSFEKSPPDLIESALFGTGGEGGERTAETYQGQEADKEDGKTRKKSVHFQSDSQAAMVVLLLSSRKIINQTQTFQQV